MDLGAGAVRTHLAELARIECTPVGFSADQTGAINKGKLGNYNRRFDR